MTRDSAFIATAVETLSQVERGEIVYTDSWDVTAAAKALKIECRDLRDVFADEPERVDAAVAEWADWVFALEEPAWRGIPLSPPIRSDLIWRVFSPIARHALAAYLIADSGTDITIDLPCGTLVGDAVMAGTRAAGGGVSQVTGGSLAALPASHKPVSPEVGASLQRYRALRTVSPLISVRSRIAGGGLLSRPRIALSYYTSLAPVIESLAERAWFALWPWALPPPRQAVGLIASGGSCLDPATSADAVDLDESRLALTALLAQASFDISGIDVSAAVRQHASAVAGELLRYSLYRTAAAFDALASTRPEAVLVPFDLGLSAAPLVGAANRLDIPTILVQHGAEGSRIPADKRLARNALVWSEAIAERYRDSPGYGEPAKFRAMGAAMLEPLRTLYTADMPSRAKILFLSHPVRHNMACDSWMASENYIAMLAKVVPVLPAGITVVGLKIHPSEAPEHYRKVMAAEGLRIPLISEGLLPDALGSAQLVAGPESTGLLEARVAGRTPVCINLSGIPMSPPFDGSTEIPVANSGDVLADLIGRWHEGAWRLSDPAPALDREIGVVEGAVEATVNAILRIAGAAG